MRTLLHSEFLCLALIIMTITRSISAWDGGDRAAAGFVGGGLAGAALGGAIGGGRGAALGAATGMATGAMIGAASSRGRYYDDGYGYSNEERRYGRSRCHCNHCRHHRRHHQHRCCNRTVDTN